MVADRGGKGDALAVMEDRLKDEDVGQMHAAGKRIVEAEHVILLHHRAEALDHRAQSCWNRSQMAW